MANSKPSAEFFREEGRRGGQLGGKQGAAARMAKLTPERRSEIARKAVAAREAKRRRRRYALALPPPDVYCRHLEILAAEAPGEAYLFGRVCLEGQHPTESARIRGITEAEVLRRVQATIRKLNAAATRKI